MPAGGKTKSSGMKGLKICCGITAISLTIIVVVFITLLFTVLKPRQPRVTAHPASLDHIEFQKSPLSLNATLGLVITIDNRNYGSFKYKNTTAYVNYHGTTVAEVPIEHQTVPAHGKLTVSTSANLEADRMISSPYFWGDVAAGSFNLTSTATLHGKVSVLKIFKMGATVFSNCDISIFIHTKDIDSKCKSKIKF